jgi:endonuclease-3
MAKVKKNDIVELINALEGLYPEAECALTYHTIFQLLVAVVLSAQTTDQSVNLVTPILFSEHPDAASIASMELEDLEIILKRIGMYHTKAKNVKRLSEILHRDFEGSVPDDYDQLITLPGVGRNTANVVLSVGFGHQRIAVDTHVFRLANRIGFTEANDELKTELALMSIIPEDHWTSIHHALIWHGRQICNARNPKCDQCGITTWCRRNGLGKDRK